MNRHSCDAAASGLPSLRRGFSWSLVGNLTYAACQWGVLVVLAKLGSAEAVGRFALGLAVTAPVILFANLNLRRVLATDARHEFAFGEYLGLTLMMLGLALVLITGIAFAGYPRETALVILALGVGKALQSVNDLFYGLYQRREHMARIAVGNMISGGLAVLLLAAAMYFTGSVIFAAMAWALAQAILIPAYNLPLSRTSTYATAPRPATPSDRSEAVERFTPSWNVRMYLALAWMALPLGVTALLFSLRTNIPRYFIERYWGESVLGIFAAIAYVVVAGRMVMNALAQTVLPRMSAHFAADDLAAFRRLMLRLLGFAATTGLLSVAVAYLVGGQLLAALYRPEYAAHTAVITWLAIGMLLGFVESFLDCGVAAARHFRFLVSANIAATAVCIIASGLLVAPYGMLGAALALALALFVQILLKSVYLLRITQAAAPAPLRLDNGSFNPAPPPSATGIAPCRESRSFAR